jgi:hypothetical protein
LKDLCARLPYGVKVQSYSYEDDVETIETLYEIDSDGCMSTLECETLKNITKPYLLPLSSMTEEQKEELENLGWHFDNFEIHNVNECLGTYKEYVAHLDCFVLIDWLNKNHFDYRGLIPTGSAIDATGKNIY